MKTQRVSGGLEGKVGLRHGPLLLIVVVELIIRNIITRDILRKVLYADDVAVVADGDADLTEQLAEWKYIMFSKHGLRVSLKTTEVMWMGQTWKELEIHTEGRRSNKKTVLYTWVKRYAELTIQTPNFAGGLKPVSSRLAVRRLDGG